MPLALGATAIVVVALLWVLAMPRLQRSVSRYRARPRRAIEVDCDPGRELRAEQRARTLLRLCVNEEEWAMYRDLGFLRVWGSSGERLPAARDAPPEGGPYAYLVYPHKPILAYLPQTGALLSEYCVAFPDHTRPYGSARLPDADDVLAKWVALTAGERALIATANMHLPGRQIDPDRVRRDLARLSRWERERLGSPGQGQRHVGSVRT